MPGTGGQLTARSWLRVSLGSDENVLLWTVDFKWINCITCELYLNQAVLRASQGAQWLKKLPAMQEAQVQSLGQEDLSPVPEEGMATHSSILAWETPWTEEPGGLQSMGLQRVRRD